MKWNILLWSRKPEIVQTMGVIVCLCFWTRIQGQWFRHKLMQSLVFQHRLLYTGVEKMNDYRSSCSLTCATFGWKEASCDVLDAYSSLFECPRYRKVAFVRRMMWCKSSTWFIVQENSWMNDYTLHKCMFYHPLQIHFRVRSNVSG